MDSGRLTDRDRVVSPGDPNGHDRVAVEAWRPGAEPTDSELERSAGAGHRSRYWRCTACGEERQHRDEFTASCPAEATAAVAVDGGYRVDDRRTRRALAAELTVRFLAFGPHYAVEGDGTRHVVDLDAETCSCGADAAEDPCEHVRRADLAVRTGELPGPDGRYVR